MAMLYCLMMNATQARSLGEFEESGKGGSRNNIDT